MNTSQGKISQVFDNILFQYDSNKVSEYDLSEVFENIKLKLILLITYLIPGNWVKENINLDEIVKEFQLNFNLNDEPEYLMRLKLLGFIHKKLFEITSIII